MIDQTTNVAEILAYPMERTPCPLCTSPRPRLPAGIATIGHCTRCNGAGVVFRPPRPEFINHPTEE